LIVKFLSCSAPICNHDVAVKSGKDDTGSRHIGLVLVYPAAQVGIDALLPGHCRHVGTWCHGIGNCLLLEL
jgi:hypothetical protein